MIKITKQISVDVAQENIIKSIVAKQYDNDSRFLKVRLTNEGKQINVNPTSVVTINALREDDEAKAFAGTVNEDGTVTVPITNWMLELDGQIKCDISVINAEQRKLSSTAFTIQVEAATYDGGNISDDDKYDILVNLIAEVKSLEEDLETKLANGEFKGEKGDKGDAGVIKFIPVTTLPTENIDENAIYIVPADNTDERNNYEEFVRIGDKWESLGVVPVEVDLTDYVKNTQFADKNGNAGVVRTKSSYGITSGRYDGNSPTTGDTLLISKASENQIKYKTGDYNPIVPSNLDYAVKMALTDSKIEWTEAEKKAVRRLLGIEYGNKILLDNATIDNGSNVQGADLEVGSKYIVTLYDRNKNIVVDSMELTCVDEVNCPPSGEVYKSLYNYSLNYQDYTELYIQNTSDNTLTITLLCWDEDGYPWNSELPNGTITLIKVNE